MKREAVKMLKQHLEHVAWVSVPPSVIKEILATDAENKRLKLLLRRLDSEGWTDRVCAGVAALKPKRRKS